MQEHTEESSVNAVSPSGKFRFRRKRRHTLKIVEEVINDSIRYKVNTYIAGKSSRRYLTKKTDAETLASPWNPAVADDKAIPKPIGTEIQNGWVTG